MASVINHLMSEAIGLFVRQAPDVVSQHAWNGWSSSTRLVLARCGRLDIVLVYRGGNVRCCFGRSHHGTLGQYSVDLVGGNMKNKSNFGGITCVF